MKSEDIIQKILEDSDVEKLFALDPESNFYIQEIKTEDLDYLREIYPDFNIFSKLPRFGVTIITRKMVLLNAYAKIKLFLNREREIISKIKNF